MNCNTFSEAISVLFVDRMVDHYRQIVKGLKSKIHVHFLESNEDGVHQITRILGTDYLEKTVKEIHLVSQGAPGCLYLGDAELSLARLTKYAKALKRWFSLPSTHLPLYPPSTLANTLSTPSIPSSLPPTLFLYNRNVTIGDAGAELIIKLGDLTGATVESAPIATLFSSPHSPTHALADERIEVDTEVSTSIPPAFPPLASMNPTRPTTSTITTTAMNTTTQSRPANPATLRKDAKSCVSSPAATIQNSKFKIQNANLSPLPSSPSTPRSLLFIDPSVDAYHHLLTGIQPGIQAHVLDAHQDGIHQITQIIQATIARAPVQTQNLASQSSTSPRPVQTPSSPRPVQTQDFASHLASHPIALQIYIVSHATPGSIRLGNTHSNYKFGQL